MKIMKWKYLGTAFVAASLLFSPLSVLATDVSTDAAAMTEKVGEMTGITDKVNVNTASADTLAKIPGIGSTIGSGITTYRDANGAFESLSDLTKVDGIDLSLLEKIKPFLSL